MLRAKQPSAPGAFFLHPGNQDYVEGLKPWTQSRRAALGALLMGSAFTLMIFVAALSFSFALLRDFSFRSGFECFGGWLTCSFLGIWSIGHWDEYNQLTQIEMSGISIYGQVLSIDYEEQSEGSKLAVVKYSFYSPSNSKIEHVERGKGKYPKIEVTEMYIIYLNDDQFVAL